MLASGQLSGGLTRFTPVHHPPGRLGRKSLVVRAAQKQQFANLEELISKSETPVLVDFYAQWCGPCQMLSPTLSAVSMRLKDRVKVVKVDTDKYPAIASRYRVQALPTLVLFKEGQPVDRIEGLLTEQQLFDRVNYYLNIPL